MKITTTNISENRQLRNSINKMKNSTKKPRLTVRFYSFWMLSFGMVLILGSTSCKKKEVRTTNTKSTVSQKTQNVEAVNPQQRSFVADILVTGTVQPNKSVMIHAMESGVITKMRKDIGDKVNKGETIAFMQNPMISELISTADANLAVGRSNLKIRQAELTAVSAKARGLRSIADRLEDVYESTPQLTTIADVESAKAHADEAQALITNKSALIEAQEKMNIGLVDKVSAAQQRQAFLSVRAPFSGTITKRYVDEGSLLQSGMNQSNPQAIVEIQETNPVRLTIPVPESDAVSIRKGMEVEVSFPELSGQTYKTTVSRTSGALDPLSKTMQVEIDIDNKKGNILTGMYAKASLQLGSRANILSLPVKSKVRYKNENYVLVVEDNIVKRIPIKIGLSDRDYFEVLNKEITANSQVIINGKGLVNPGQEVKVTLSK